MPAGDAQRAWFPEMLEELKNRWKLDMSWNECIQLCRNATATRTKLKKEKGIAGPLMFCKNCNDYHEMSPMPIGIRSLLFALKKEGLIDDHTFEIKDKEWKKYQRKHQLDAIGNPKKQRLNQPSEVTPRSCASHSTSS